MNPLSCANKKQPPPEPSVPCQNPGTKACSNCHLVLYCSKTCQTTHWPIHKKDCKHVLRDPTWRPTWESEKRVPAFLVDSAPSHTGGGEVFGGAKTEFWGRVPAVDVLRLEGNEGVSREREKEKEKEVRVLFPASGDLRNLVKTIVSLPEGYKGRVTVDMNDDDEIVVARNLLLLLTAMSCTPEEAALLMVHLWYSAFLSANVVQRMINMVMPLIQAAIDLNPKEEDESELVQASWKRNETLLAGVFHRDFWNMVNSFFPRGLDKNGGTLTSTEAAALRMEVTLAPNRRDYRERAMFRLPPSWRLASFKFRGVGILLPFGACCDEFTIPNPTFFTDNLMYPLLDMANPLDGWSLSEVIDSSTWKAKDDIYGHLYIYLTKTFAEFSRRLSSMNITISLFNSEPAQLPTHIITTREGNASSLSYDRIDLSTLGQPNQLGPELALIIFSPFLRPKLENPHATILALFLDPDAPNSDSDSSSDTLGRETCQKQPKLPPNPILRFTSTLSQPLTNKIHSTYLPITKSIILNTYVGGHNADVINFMGAHDLFLDREGPFGEFVDWYDLVATGKALRIAMKECNQQSIVKRWVLGLDEDPSKNEFDLLFWSGHGGRECYVEWTRPWEYEDLLLAMMERLAL